MCPRGFLLGALIRRALGCPTAVPLVSDGVAGSSGPCLHLSRHPRPKLFCCVAAGSSEPSRLASAAACVTPACVYRT